MEAVNWPTVALALIAALPGIIAAFYGHRNAASLRTANQKTVGQMVEEVHGAASEEATSFPTHWPRGRHRP